MKQSRKTCDNCVDYEGIKVCSGNCVGGYIGSKLTASLIVCLSLLGCGGGSGGAGDAATPIQGINLSGNYNSYAVGCYDNTSSSLVASGSLINGSINVNIVGNDANVTINSTNGCIVKEHLTVDFLNSSVLNESNVTITSVTGGFSCTAYLTVDTINGVSPGTISGTYVQGGSYNNVNTLYDSWSGGIIIENSGFHGPANSTCYIEYN